MSQLILASKSAIRQSLLANAGINFIVSASHLDERLIDDGSLDPVEAALTLAEEKARTVSLNHPEALVIGADQTLSLGTLRLHKPTTRDQAYQQLWQLRGQSHQLTSACALVRSGALLTRFERRVLVTFRPFSSTCLENYLTKGGDQVFTSVGGYQIEGLGAQLIESVEGDWTTILGLPLFDLLAALRALDFLPD